MIKEVTNKSTLQNVNKLGKKYHHIIHNSEQGNKAIINYPIE